MCDLLVNSKLQTVNLGAGMGITFYFEKIPDRSFSDDWIFQALTIEQKIFKFMFNKFQIKYCCKTVQTYLNRDLQLKAADMLKYVTFQWKPRPKELTLVLEWASAFN